jgi:hypothetical protein
MKRLKKCQKCNQWFLEKDYFIHTRTHYSAKNYSSDEKILTTDDSGVLISIEDYASLHGEVSSSASHERDYYDANIVKNKNTESVFQKIAQMASEPIKKIQPFRKIKSKKLKCRYCNKFIEKDKINEHNNLYHPNEMPSKNTQEIHSLLPKHKKKNKNEPDIAPEGKLGNMAEAFKQAFNETRYGAKGMHHRHEWDGKFGSTPLHDDYDDESDS